MKKLVMKKGMVGLYAMICAGMLLFTGCAGTEVKTETEKMEVSDNQDSNAANSSNTVDEKKEGSEEMENSAQSDSKDETATDGEKKNQEQNTFADGNDLIKSADLEGPASGCSDEGCMINTSSFASVDEDGASTSGSAGIIKVTYTDETVFQKGTVKSDGSSYSLEDSEKNGLKDNDYVLCFGNQQADGTYLADRIIVITFN